MSKKRNRQPDANGELYECSTDSCNESNNTDNKCPHIPKAVNFNKIKKCVNKVGISMECSICKKCKNDSSKLNEKECVTNSAVLICLQCGYQGCGREECGHALEHYKKPHSDCHVMVVESLYWSVWCFQCETKINIGCRKKLQETVEFIKRSSTVKNSLQTKTSITQYQNETVDISKVDKEKGLYNLPKVGGLMNLGNTCFFNAVLQCLAQTPFLVKVLDDLRLPGQKFILPGGKHKFANNSEEVDLPPIEGILEGWGSFTSILCKTLTEMQNTDERQSYRPSELLNSFKKKTTQCMDGGQHDSHELLRHLLEIVRNEDLRRYQSIILKEVGLNEKTNPEGVEENLKSRVKFYGNQASSRLLGPELVFRGVLVSTLECLDCHHSSQSTEPFLDLSLPVMADKPQPPVLKRKNNGFEDTFDIMGNNISHVPSKYQSKKEKKAARKKRKNKKQDIRDHGDSSVPDKSNTVGENNSVLESEESDADVEDNAEIEGILPEVAESGYSSEKPSTLTSPASPSTDTMKAREATNEIPLDNDLQFGATNNISLIQLLNRFDANSLPSSSSNACTPNLSQTKALDALDSSESLETESGIQTRFSISTSLAMTSDLTSPEDPTVSFNPIMSKESSSSMITLANDETVESIKLSTPSLNLKDSVNHIEQEASTCNQWKTRRKTEECSNDVNNRIDNITSGISKIGINGSLQQSPTRYTTKEGECSIQSCLNQFTALELMSGSNKVSCEACTARERKVRPNCKMICTPSTKQYLISRVPAVLILHLKRFQAQRVDFRKVTRHVSFPILLDLAPICKNHKKARIYALYGVVEHSGTIHGGHYVAYVKSRLALTSDDPRWSFLPPKDVRDLQESSYSSSSESETEEAAAAPSSTVRPPPGKWYHVSDSSTQKNDFVNSYVYFSAYPTKILFRTMKSLVNEVNNAVTESLFGLSFAFPQLEYQESHKVVLMPNLQERKHKVSLICGGGSGHEPFAAGYVGNGMLAAAVAGSIYAAPPSKHISYAIDRVSQYNNTGILMVVPNYTGDCLNFGIAIEKARQKGLKISEVIVNEDCSIPKEEQGVAGKRGLTGIIFVMKIAGALAEQGLSLEEVTKTAHDVLQNIATYSVGLTACAIPGQSPMFELGDDEIEVGQGIHGEAGYEKMKLKPCSEIVAFMLKRLREALSLKSGDSVAVIINNFGALSQLEQGIVVYDVVKHLRSMNIEPLRVYAGLLMTSLNSAGVHITLLKLSGDDKSFFLGCLDAPTVAPKWPGCVYSISTENARKVVQDPVVRTVETIGMEITLELQNLLKQCLKSACESIIQKETHLNDLDRGCGDGDTGSTLNRLATGILGNLDKFQFSHPSSVFTELAHIAEEEMGGTSGALYCLFFTSITTELVLISEKEGWLQIWARTFRSGLNCLIKYGKAKPGDRSMVDALNAFCDTFENLLHKPLVDICDALKIATWKACESTKNMKAKVGRASYVKQTQYFQKVDAGAYAVATCVEAITNVLKNFN